MSAHENMEIELSKQDEENIESILQGICNPDSTVQLRAAESLLKIVETASAPIDTINRPEVLHTFIQLLTKRENPALQFLSCNILANIVKASSEAGIFLLQAGAASHLAELLRSQVHVGQALWTLAILSENGPDARQFVWQKTVLATIKNFRAIDTPVKVLRNIVHELQRIIEHRYPSRPLEVVRECVPIITQFLSANNPEVATSTCPLVAFLTRRSSDSDDNDNNQRIQTFIDAEVDRKLVNIISRKKLAQNVITPVLEAISNMTTGNDQQREHLLELGCLTLVARFLTDPERTISQLATCIAANICAGGNQNHIQMLMDSEVFPILLKIIKIDIFFRQPALAVANIAVYGSKKQINRLLEMMVGNGGYEIVLSFCLLLDTQNVDELKVVLQALENLLKANTEKGQAEVFMTNIQSAHGTKILRKLQQHPSQEISTKASHLIVTYFLNTPLVFRNILCLMVEK